jgi:hypothetical protein
VYTSPNIIRVIKSWGMGLEEDVSHIGEELYKKGQKALRE